MSDKTTEEAAEILHRHLGHATGLWQHAPILAAMEEYKDATIAQIREENERLRVSMQKASVHLMNLQPHIQQLENRYKPFIDTHVDMAMEVLSEALTPKPPKTNGK